MMSASFDKTFESMVYHWDLLVLLWQYVHIYTHEESTFAQAFLRDEN